MYRHLSQATMWSILISLFLFSIITVNGLPAQAQHNAKAPRPRSPQGPSGNHPNNGAKSKAISGAQPIKNGAQSTIHSGTTTTAHPKTNHPKTTEHPKTTVHPRTTVHPKTTEHPKNMEQLKTTEPPKSTGYSNISDSAYPNPVNTSGLLNITEILNTTNNLNATDHQNVTSDLTTTDLPDTTAHFNTTDSLNTTENPSTQFLNSTDHLNTTDFSNYTDHLIASRHLNVIDDPNTTDLPNSTDVPIITDLPISTDQPIIIDVPTIIYQPSSTDQPSSTAQPKTPGHHNNFAHLVATKHTKKTYHPKTTTDLPTTTNTTKQPTKGPPFNKTQKHPSRVIDYLDYSHSYTTPGSLPKVKIRMDQTFDEYFKEKQKEMVELYDKFGVEGAKKILLKRLSIHKEKEPSIDDEKYVAQMLYAALTEYHTVSDSDSDNSTRPTSSLTSRPVYFHNATKYDAIDEDYEYVSDLHRYSKNPEIVPENQPIKRGYGTTTGPSILSPSALRTPNQVDTQATPEPKMTKFQDPDQTTPLSSQLTIRLAVTERLTELMPIKPETQNESHPSPLHIFYSDSVEQTKSPVVLVDEPEFLSETTSNPKIHSFNKDELAIVPEPSPHDTKINKPDPEDSLETMMTSDEIDVGESYPPEPEYASDKKADSGATIIDNSSKETQTDSKSLGSRMTTGIIAETPTVARNESASAGARVCPTVAELFNKAKEFWEKLKTSEGIIDDIGIIWEAVIKSVQALGQCIYQLAADIFSNFLAGNSVDEIFKFNETSRVD